MKITINNNRKIFAVQEEFNAKFPFLKLEFFSKPHKAAGSSPKNLMKSNSKTLADCRAGHEEGILTITPNMTVAELEQRFADAYGLSVQVFRKSGKVWLETTITDGWTLADQNEEGQILSTVKQKTPES
jgi:hypothetical protein